MKKLSCRSTSFLFLVFFFLFIFQAKAFASENFSTNYNVHYQVLEDGTSNVVIDVTLTNKTEVYFAPSYAITVGFEDIQNLKARDPDGPITPDVIKDNDKSKIEVVFNKGVVGLGNSITFQISFTTSDVARKFGRIWKVDIPGVSNAASFSTFTLSLNVPDSFAEPSYIKTDFNKPVIRKKQDVLTFTKDELGSSGISLVFGDYQAYAFRLLYHLKNKNLFPIETEIAIPQSTNYQNVLIDYISPAPLNIEKDKDGNWLAMYYLSPGKKMDIEVKGKAQVFLYPKKEALSQLQRNAYLRQIPYWSANNEITTIAKELKTPQAIYEYVVNNLTYDFKRVEENRPRLGAANSLKNRKSAVCLEFTDLFIALSRAASIPAREVNGYAFTENSKLKPLSLVQDVLHAWPEYYDSDLQTWIMVDPTWGNTTDGFDYFSSLDFDHFTFVVKGHNSSYPVPAGGYKLQGMEQAKDVTVEFTDFIETPVPKVVIEVDLPQTASSGLPIKGIIKVKNVTSTPSNPQTITIYSQFLKSDSQRFTIPSVPPYGFIQKQLEFQKTPFLTNKKEVITIRFDNTEVSRVVHISPFTISLWSILGGGIVVGSIILISIITRFTWSIYIQRQKRQSPLRRESKEPKNSRRKLF